MNARGSVRAEVLGVSGDPAVAEVAVLRLGGRAEAVVEVVDGLTPPLGREDKWIVNLSTQFGCPVGCPTCDAGGGYHGDLDTQELLAQVDWALGRHPGMAGRCRKLKVHFARMGEPSLNPAVLACLRALPGRLQAPGLWACVASVAPRGREGWFEELRQLKARLYPDRFQLQFSLQSTDPAARARLIPLPCWSFEEIAAYGARFHRPGERKLVLNFALARGVPFEPEALLAHFPPQHFLLKLTPINPTARGRQAGLETTLRGPAAESLAPALARLQAAGFEVICSVGDGREDRIGSNCGQAVRALGAQQAAAPG
ncbi:MAG TPA: radical SAM protein [Myxococcota bacterium]|nr:radical SAM protein [Myxococcota bacterium]HRY96835.1 radical SAM protein [Myxococcota bacterium]HSA21679.1 radical SAM protein [Myxococcota bacterium]